MVDVAALFVEARGVYASIAGVDVWSVDRDARGYAGASRVVAHLPCARWGRFARGGPSHHGRFVPGDDGGCFAAALASVRRCGGVLEHPAGSMAWREFGLLEPPRSGGWVTAGDWRGWVCCVDQGHYGHPAPKASWLYAVGVEVPRLIWRRSGAKGRVEFLCRRRREATPEPFARLLVSMARGA